MSSPALQAEALSARYAGQAAWAPALRDVSLVVEPGQRLLLLGPNGAGKSTLVRVFTGLMRPERGEALVLGIPARQARHLVGVVAHATYLYEELTARENVRLYARLYGVENVAGRTAEVLEEVGVSRRADEPVGQLSRGLQQRVALARALVHDPPVLLLDEPDTALDLGAFALLEGIVRRAGRTVLVTTHNVAYGVRLATCARVLDAGAVVHTLADLGADAERHLSGVVQALAAERTVRA